MTDGPTSESKEEVAYSVRNLIPKSWPSGMLQELERWQQGDLMNVTALAWLGTAGVDPVTGMEAQEEWDALNATSQVGWSIIVSQTCDIDISGPGGKHPFIFVCPLTRIPDTDPNQANIKDWKVKYFAHVTDVPEAGFWAADLRVLIPVSKSLLIGRNVIHGYSNSSLKKQFTSHLASKFRRGAFHESISVEIRKLLDDAFAELKKSQIPSSDIEQIRLDCRPDDLNCTHLTIHLICKIDVQPEVKQPFFDRQSEMAQTLGDAGIALVDIKFDSLETLKVVEYRSWTPMEINSLRIGWF